MFESARARVTANPNSISRTLPNATPDRIPTLTSKIQTSTQQRACRTITYAISEYPPGERLVRVRVGLIGAGRQTDR